MLTQQEGKGEDRSGGEWNATEGNGPEGNGGERNGFLTERKAYAAVYCWN